MPKVSVIIPVYNLEKYLRQCLDSVINQTFKDIEIICVNDGSTDNSLQTLKEYAKKDERIRVINQENRGLSVARNVGIIQANGEYIVFIDPDDFIEQDCFMNFVEKYMDYNADLFISKVFYYKQNAKSEPKRNEIITKYSNHTTFMPYEISKFISYVHGKFYKRDFIIKNNLKFPKGIKTAEDGIFNLSLFLKEPKIKFINLYTYNYRLNVKNSATSNPYRAIKTDIEAFMYFLLTDEFKNSSEEWKIIAINKYINALEQYYKKISNWLLKLISSYRMFQYYKFMKKNIPMSVLNKTNYKGLKKYSFMRKFIQSIFSVKNSKNNHKIITILGIKIKYRRK